MLSPERICTIAFFQRRVVPRGVVPRRLGFLLTLIVRTSTTWTSKRLSTAWRMWVLWASGCTRKV